MPGELLSIPKFASEDEEWVDAQRAAESDPCLDAEDLGAPSKYIITGRAWSGKSTRAPCLLLMSIRWPPAGRKRRIRSSLPGEHSRPCRSTRPEELPPDYRRVMVRVVGVW